MVLTANELMSMTMAATCQGEGNGATRVSMFLHTTNVQLSNKARLFVFSSTSITSAHAKKKGEPEMLREIAKARCGVCA